MTVNPNTVLYAVAAAGKGGVRFALFWLFAAVWSLAAGVLALVAIEQAGLGTVPNGGFLFLCWAVVYLHAMGFSIWRRTR